MLRIAALPTSARSDLPGIAAPPYDTSATLRGRAVGTGPCEGNGRHIRDASGLKSVDE